MVRVLRLPGLAPLRFHSPRTERMMENIPSTPSAKTSKEEEASLDFTTLTIPPPQVDYGHARRNDPSMRVDDVPRSPFGEHQRAV